MDLPQNIASQVAAGVVVGSKIANLKLARGGKTKPSLRLMALNRYTAHGSRIRTSARAEKIPKQMRGKVIWDYGKYMGASPNIYKIINNASDTRSADDFIDGVAISISVNDHGMNPAEAYGKPIEVTKDEWFYILQSRFGYITYESIFGYNPMWGNLEDEYQKWYESKYNDPDELVLAWGSKMINGELVSCNKDTKLHFLKSACEYITDFKTADFPRFTYGWTQNLTDEDLNFRSQKASARREIILNRINLVNRFIAAAFFPLLGFQFALFVRYLFAPLLPHYDLPCIILFYMFCLVGLLKGVAAIEEESAMFTFLSGLYCYAWKKYTLAFQRINRKKIERWVKMDPGSYCPYSLRNDHVQGLTHINWKMLFSGFWGENERFSEITYSIVHSILRSIGYHERRKAADTNPAGCYGVPLVYRTGKPKEVRFIDPSTII